MLTQEELKQKLLYDPKTGVFTWRDVTRNVKEGTVAGWATTKGYVAIQVNGTSYLAHRLAWLYVTGSWPVSEIDHKNRVRNANMFNNLRPATHMQNSTNRALSVSGTPGVVWYKPLEKWRALIRVGKKKVHLGYFICLEKAIAARRSAEITYYGVAAFKKEEAMLA